MTEVENISIAPPAQPIIEAKPIANGSHKNFSVTDSIASGWHLFWQRPGYFIGLTFLPFLLSLLIQVIAGIFFGIVLGNDNKEALNIFKSLVNLVTSIGSFFLMVGIMRGYIESVQGLKPELKEIFEPRGMVIKYLLVSIITGLIIMVGYLVFIIPGVIFSLMFSFAPYVLIDEKRGIVESLKRSQDLTKSVKIKLLLFFIAISFVNIIGFLCLGVGVLVTSPVSALATVYVYETLKKKTA